MSGNGPGHLDRAFEAELQELRDQLVAMAGLVERMIGDAVRSLVTDDSNLARRTIELDHQVNAAEVAIDGLCHEILARRQPLASDLRFITQTLKMVTDLERIGDVAVNVCERVLGLSRTRLLGAASEIPAIADICREMVHDAIEAFVRRDAKKAEAVIARDDAVDDRYHRLSRELLDVMRGDPEHLEQAIALQAIAKHLERVGDHATNLAEQAIFLVRGMDVRHLGKR